MDDDEEDDDDINGPDHPHHHLSSPPNSTSSGVTITPTTASFNNKPAMEEVWNGFDLDPLNEALSLNNNPPNPSNGDGIGGFHDQTQQRQRQWRGPILNLNSSHRVEFSADNFDPVVQPNSSMSSVGVHHHHHHHGLMNYDNSSHFQALASATFGRNRLMENNKTERRRIKNRESAARSRARIEMSNLRLIYMLISSREVPLAIEASRKFECFS